MWELKLVATPTSAGIRRALMLRPDISRPNVMMIALAEIDTSIPDVTVTWGLPKPNPPRARRFPRKRQTPTLNPFFNPSPSYVGRMIDYWIAKFLPDHGFDPSRDKIELEFWLAGQFNARTIVAPVTRDKILSEVTWAKIKPDEEPSLILLNYSNIVMEMNFDGPYPIECSCVLRQVFLPKFIGFFRLYHENANVRSEAEISIKAFSDSTKINGALNFFAPVPTFS